MVLAADAVLLAVAGQVEPDGGSVTLDPGLTVGYLPQEVDLPGNVALHLAVTGVTPEVLACATEMDRLERQMHEAVGDRARQLGAQYSDLSHRFDGLHGFDYQVQARGILQGLGFEEADYAKPVRFLSGGQKTRAALAKLLMLGPDLLLLDEPTNHLDAESVEWLEQFLHRYPGTVVAVTHDRYFLDNAAEWILELDRGRGIPWKGNYTDWLQQKDERLKQEENQEKARQKAIQKELEWARQNAKGGRSKGKARLARIEELQSVDYQKRNETNEIFIPVAERLGTEVIEFKGVTKSFGDRLLIDDLSFSVPPGAIVGIIGPNGAGKSTLFKMIIGKETPDSGSIEIGPTVQLAYVDQSRDALEVNHNVFQEVSGGSDILNINGIEIQSRAYIGRFNFKGQDQQKIVSSLSGGERGRLHLAKTLLQGGNVLLLDEPSNDLDVETLRALEDALLEFAGCVLVISHDRWFLDRIATHILAAEGDSQWTFFNGNYQEYEADKRKRLGEEGAKPKRLRYKPITR